MMCEGMEPLGKGKTGDPCTISANCMPGLGASQPGDPLTYLQRRILTPIGLTYAGWRRGPDGNPMLPQGAQLTAREWAKFGEFVRAGGKVGGKSIVDPVTFAAMFRGSEVHPGYGLT